MSCGECKEDLGLEGYTEPEYMEELYDREIIFPGSDWVEDPENGHKDGPMKGFRHNGYRPVVNCNDLFWWATGDCEPLTNELVPQFRKAVRDCEGNYDLAVWLFCARQRKMRPQGAAYSYIPKHLWQLFHDCGPERETGLGNPCAPGEYKTACRAK